MQIRVRGNISVCLSSGLSVCFLLRIIQWSTLVRFSYVLGPFDFVMPQSTTTKQDLDTVLPQTFT